MKITISEWDIYTLGDHAIVFSLSPKIDPQIAHQIKQLSSFIGSKNINGIKDIIPAYHTLTIIVDLIQFTPFHFPSTENIETFCSNLIHDFSNSTTANFKQNDRLIRVPVCYELGLDLKQICQDKQLSISEFIQLHCNQIYTVYCLGFLPGFAYMGTVDERIQYPRHAQPRSSVPAGSVGIAGLQTGIYPTSCPGGWQIIGLCPLKIFDADPDKLAKFKVGDQIQFYPINQSDYNQLNEYA